LRGHRGIIDNIIGHAIMVLLGDRPLSMRRIRPVRRLPAIDCWVAFVYVAQGNCRSCSAAQPAKVGVRHRIGSPPAGPGRTSALIHDDLSVMATPLTLRHDSKGPQIYGTHSCVSNPPWRPPRHHRDARNRSRWCRQTQSQAVSHIMGRKDELTPHKLLLRSTYSEGLAVLSRPYSGNQARTRSNSSRSVPRDGPLVWPFRAHRPFPGHPAGRTFGGVWYLDHNIGRAETTASANFSRLFFLFPGGAFRINRPMPS